MHQKVKSKNETPLTLTMTKNQKYNPKTTNYLMMITGGHARTHTLTRTQAPGISYCKQLQLAK